jgi:hypothetical protein
MKITFASMRHLAFACFVVAGCSKKGVEHHHADKLAFKSFTIAVPAGWDEVTDQKLLGNAAPGSHTLMGPTVDPGFPASIYIQEIEMAEAEHQQLAGASDDWCREVFLKAVTDKTQFVPDSAKSAEFRGFKGCDLVLHDRASPQAARNISVSNGKVSLGITCNRNKAGASDVDAACVEIARSISPK